MSFDQHSRTSWHLRLKRVADVVLSSMGIVIAVPWMFAIAVLIRLDSEGTILFRQRRLGKGGEVFEILKFRTMVDGAVQTSAGLVTYEGDPRITRVGRLLRQLHLDELPQLLNILRGDMSFVGPRPALPFHFDYYENWERARLNIPPGLTGWSQINGGTMLDWDRRIELDVWYVQHCSTWLDMQIIARTVWVVARRLVRREATQTPAGEHTWTRGVPDDPYSNSVSRAREATR